MKTTDEQENTESWEELERSKSMKLVQGVEFQMPFIPSLGPGTLASLRSVLTFSGRMAVKVVQYYKTTLSKH